MAKLEYHGQTIDIFGLRSNTQTSSSALSGKSISILGDSISTYSGYIPSGNATYYSSSNLSSVNDTWWKKVIDNLNLTLVKNNSWSGSRVCNDKHVSGTTTGASGLSRGSNLGSNPDIIIVYLGTNDYLMAGSSITGPMGGDGTTLGTFSGVMGTSTATTATTFCDGYSRMLKNILTAYPKATVYTCTLLSGMEWNSASGTDYIDKNANNNQIKDYNDAIRKISDYLGIKVIDLASCGITWFNRQYYTCDYSSHYAGSSLHPNAAGHTLIAKQVEKTLLYQ